MIIEQRTYTLKPGTVQPFLALYQSDGLDVQAEALGNLVGYFVTETGELNRVVQLWGFETFEDRLQRRRALSQSEAWRAFLTKAGSYVIEQRSELLMPAPFSPIR
ncbi:NIPSNAP family protein [Caballeronia cordobensis]|uniref:NIPSNAP family protein n=1 Tax=Caballeronia cordobensis TaxID=1353886 RepID=A0A158I579_CABCO|nr:NIPSNAP family protein [Caballeronia cordobensis]SAL51762.1 NIPSNAP family protein [Caballeronia cordobensis]